MAKKTVYSELEVQKDIIETINSAKKINNSKTSDNAAGEKVKKSVIVIGEEQIKTAIETLNEYKNQKKNFDNRVIDNEEWWKMRHWEQIRNSQQSTEPTSAWLFNSIMNKL
ncbi:MAG: hypothetical protein IJ731_06180, partial [Eubacterium sp.]|nr:hypothetical protein [Eubacterium sp.]